MAAAMAVEGGGRERGSAVWDCPDLAIACFCQLDVKSLCSATCVCTAWRHLAGSEELWRAKMESIYGPALPLSLPQQRLEKGLGHWKRLLKSTSDLRQSLTFRQALSPEGVASSSQAGTLSIDWTLCDEYFWRSEVTGNPEGEEYLTYKLEQPLCIVTGVEIVPACLRRIYAPRQLQVDVGFDETQFHFSSHTENVENELAAHTLLFQTRGLVVGDHVRLRLRGMHEANAEPVEGFNFGDSFCMAIQRVRIFGIPIGLVVDNLLAEAFVCHALQLRSFRAAVRGCLKPPIGEELQVDEIVAGFRAQMGLPSPLWPAPWSEDNCDSMLPSSRKFIQQRMHGRLRFGRGF